MSLAVLDRADDRLPPRFAMLARFAVVLTAQPWSLTGGVVDDFAEHGFGEDAIEAAAGVVAVFNYLTRVADATGIEFDYESPLPAFEPDPDQHPEPRPSRESWPVIDEQARTSSRFRALSEGWRRWHDYVFESDEPLTHRDRRLLARAAAEESCDRWRADELREYEPQNKSESILDEFGRKLASAPWQMRPDDLDVLREAGHPETALLHAIAVVALQSAESRLAMGRAAAGGS